MAGPGEQPSVSGLRWGRLGARLSRPDPGHRLMRLTDSRGFLFFPTSPSWQMLQIDLEAYGSSSPRHPHESLSFLPLCLDLSACPGSGTLEWTRVCAGGGGHLLFSLVQRTRFVKNVNKTPIRLASGGEEAPPAGNASRVFHLLYL